jgi:VIT1/CCC1 family predicted Fe2+/Mn2+ transporter
MKHTLKTGISFGLTSGIITTLGLMVGLNSGTGSKMVIIGGILMIAIADAFSDALGIHVSEESENRHSPKEIWESTAYTFLSKFVFSLTFLAAILIFPLALAIKINIIWGLSLLSLFSFYIAKNQKENPLKVTAEHLGIALLVITLTHLAGDWINSFCH